MSAEPPAAAETPDPAAAELVVTSYHPAALADAATGLLERLATRLAAAGWRASIHTAPGRLPMLDVANPALGMLADVVTARPDADGEWWLWWSWAQRIGPAGNLEHAAAVITRVLGSHDG